MSDIASKYLELQVKKLSERSIPEVIFVEVGTSKGSSALRILKGIHKSGVKRWFFTIDPYGNKPYRYEEETSTTMNYDEEDFRQAMFKIIKYAYEKEMLHYHWRMLSFDFMKVFPKIEFWYESKRIEKPWFGFVYLDGEHTWDIVYEEFKWFYRRMPVGGMIVIDDVHFLGKEEGVRRLLSEFKGEFKFKKVDNNYKAYFTKV